MGRKRERVFMMGNGPVVRLVHYKLTKELHKHNNCCNHKITKEGVIALFSICTEWEAISQAFFCYQGKRVQQPDPRHLKAKDAFTEYSKEIKNLLIVP